MEDPSENERWRVGASLWKAIGGDAIAARWQDLLADPLATPISLSNTTKDDLGRWGESLAVQFLRQQLKAKILRRNFRAPHGGEVDIVCRREETLLFVEVKTRTSTSFGRPLAAVDEEKQQLIARGALEWLRLLNQPDLVFRFDVIEVILREGEIPDIQCVENAFELPDNYYLPG